MQLFKFHFAFFLSRLTLIIFGVIFFLLFLIYGVTLGGINGELAYEEILNAYFVSSVASTHLAALIASVLLFIRIAGEKNLYLTAFALACGYSKKANYFTSLGIALIMQLSYLTLLFCAFLITGFIGKKYFYFKIVYLKAFVYVFLLSVYYGLLAFSLYAFFPNQFLPAGIVLAAMLSDTFAPQKNIFARLYLLLFPALNSAGGFSFLRCLRLVLAIFFLIFVGLKIYKKLA